MKRLMIVGFIALLAGFPATSRSQTGAASLRLVIVLTRHGVRTPTHPAELAQYASRPWPVSSTPPAYLTPHGALLMRQFGAYYRRAFAGMDMFVQPGCPTAGALFVWADVDERTRATAQALLDGLVPGCGTPVLHAAGKTDPLFDPVSAYGGIDAQRSRASLAGAIGNDPNALLRAHRAEFDSLDDVLGCGPTTSCKPLSHLPSTIVQKGDGRLASLSGSIVLASTAVENLLLEYADGQPEVGWGRIDGARLLDLIQLHLLSARLEYGNWYAARARGSNVLSHITDALEQAARDRPIAGTRLPLSTQVAFIVGHDTTLTEMAGILHLSWLMNGYQMNDTPPGGALVFELHARRGDVSRAVVRLFFVAQSLDDMRSGRGDEPGRVPVYIPGCPGFDCPVATLRRVVDSAIDRRFVGPWR